MNSPPLALTRLTRIAPLVATAALALLAACSAMPARNAALDQARSRLDAAQGRPDTVAMAADELARAREAMRRADQALINGDGEAQVTHLAYLAQQQVAVAEETAASRKDQAIVTGAAAERDRTRLAMRTREADTARAQATAAQQDSANKTVQLARSEAGSQAERDRAARRDTQRDAQLSDLQGQLRELNAQQSERGMIVTLGDLLFDTGASRMRPQGQHSMDQLAGFMKRNPEQRASIEGYTDSTGNTAANQALSERRAQSVMAALVLLGVPGSQLSTQAFGQDRPVAGNDTPAGRLMNRRVEVVFARAGGDTPRK